MIHFTCTNCTADLSAEDSQRFITCGWCRRQIEVPRLTKLELDSFTRANRQRQNKQFAEAEKNYQLVLNAHPQDHEALWGLVLCHYGIVYVEDKGDVLPTCWICRPQPILEYPDYQDACALVEEKRHALEAGGVRDEDVEKQIAAYDALLAQRKRDGQYICKAQQDIRHLSETMQPYDIFLCYKHSVIGNPDALTEDSQLANDLCLMLSKEGYRVFYAPVDTKGRAGENYESLIYHALKTAKVMLTISTRPDHLLCSWPKSEWSRFIYMMNQGEDKHLIPLYKHMRVSALPDAFLNRGWTAFDMGDQFYGKYLLDNLKRYIHKRHEKAAPPVNEPAAEPQAAYLCAAATLFAKPDAASQALTQMPANAALLALERVRATNGAYWYMVQMGVDVGYVAYGAVKLGDAPVVATPVAKVETPMVAEQPVQKAATPTVTAQTPVTQSAPAAAPQKAAESVQRNETPASCFKYLIQDDGTVAITGHTEQIAEINKLDIPRQIERKRVTAIGNDAFRNCDSLTSISIPDSVTTIDDWAFIGCTGLTSISIPDSVTSIGKAAFSDCTSLTSISIPDSVTAIGDWAFDYCTNLTSISISDSVTSIGDRAFACCTSLTSISIPDSVTSIGSDAFRNCINLTSISIPGSGTSIGSEAFLNCTSLTSISIPDSVTFIGNSAFFNCPNLTIHAPYGAYAITYAKKNSIPYKELGTPAAVPQAPKKDAEKPVLKDETPASCFKYEIQDDGTVAITGHTEQITKGSKLVIPQQIEGKSVTAIGNDAFYICTNLTSISIPDSVTAIGDTAFFLCESLTSISIPDSVTAIGDWAFSDCTSLTSISIPDSVTSIGYGAFRDCTSLTSISIPASVTSIDGNAFTNCPTLTIHAPYGAYAITYAKKKSIPYKELGTPVAPPKPTATYPLLVRGYMYNVQEPPSSDTSDSLTPAFKQKMRDAFRLNASTEILYASGLFGLAYINNPYARYYFTSSGVIFPRLGFLATLETKNALKLTWKEFMTAAIEDTTILKLHYIKINGQTVHAAGPFGGAGTKANVDKWLAFYHGLQDYLRKNAHLIDP